MALKAQGRWLTSPQFSPMQLSILCSFEGLHYRVPGEEFEFFLNLSGLKLLTKPEVWFAAVAQCFFSLTVGFGPVIMYSSYNGFRQNIYR